MSVVEWKPPATRVSGRLGRPGSRMERMGELERVDYDAELHLLHEALRAAYQIAPDDRVLDVGCGTGLTTRDAARLAGRGWAVGVDVSGEMLRQARSLAAAAGIENVTFEVGDAQEHAFPAQGFDVVISRFGTM